MILCDIKVYLIYYKVKSKKDYKFFLFSKIECSSLYILLIVL